MNKMKRGAFVKFSSLAKMAARSHIIKAKILDTSTTASGLSQALTNEKFIIFWLDSNIDESNANFKAALIRFEQTVDAVNVFTDSEQCVESFKGLEDEKVYMIVPNTLGQLVIPRIHGMPRLDRIYVLQRDQDEQTRWTRDWAKVKGVFTDVDEIYDIIKRKTERSEHDFVSISVTGGDSSGLDPSFMYTQLLKETLLEIEYQDKDKRELVEHCRNVYSTDANQLQIIDEFERDYEKYTPIWWYSREGFTYQMLNHALRTQEAQNIIKMGFFLRDVHRHIEQLHQLQNKDRKTFTVYRGQGLAHGAFDKIKQNEGGLLAFNNCLSTSLDEEQSMNFAEKARGDLDKVGILFEMTIDPSITSVPFAAVKEYSAFPQEEEILFSMHTVFRVRTITAVEDRLWRIDLAFTSDDDEELKLLTDHIRKETQGQSGWRRIGKMLHRLGEFKKAEKVYQLELESVTEDNEQDYCFLCNALGRLKDDQGDYEGALDFYQKSLEVKQKCLPADHPDLSTTYHNIANAYDQLGEYSRALEFYSKSLEIELQSHPPDHQDLAPTYSNIGDVHKNLGEYSKALELYGQALDIYKKNRPANHPDFGYLYSNIGSVHHLSAEYSKALECYKKSHEIYQKSLPPQHPDVISILNSIGSTYTKMTQYSKALEFYDKALTICKNSDASNFSHLACIYLNLGEVYETMGDYSKALDVYDKSLEIWLQNRHSDPTNVAALYNNVASIHNRLGQYPKAFEFYEKSLEIDLKLLPPNHPFLAITYGNIGQVHNNVGDYSKALELHQKSLEIRQDSFPPNHPNLAKTYFNIGEVYIHMLEFPKAFEFHMKSLDIRQDALPSEHPDLAHSYHSIGQIHDQMRNYPKALDFHQRALRIRQKCLPPMHPDTAQTYNSIGELREHMGEYSKALELYNKSLEIRQKALPLNHPDLIRTNSNIGRVREQWTEHPTSDASDKDTTATDDHPAP